MAFAYKFSAVRGIQAKREYFIAMVPLCLISKLFGNEDDYLPPEYRAQRCINESRIPEIRNYIIKNRNNYVFSALSASIDGPFSFLPSEIDKNVGILEVDMNSHFLINDGQHRKAAIEAALIEQPDLANETISIVFFKDEGLVRSQQMFADLNKHAVKSTMSLSTLYDSRDDLANAVKHVVEAIPFLKKYVDKEKDNLGKNSLKLFTLSNFLKANRRILRDGIAEDDEAFLIQYWTAIFTNIDEWESLENRRIYKCTMREEYVLTLSVTINAFGRLGRYFYETSSDLILLRNLNKINWLRNNPELFGRIINNQGKIIANEDAIIKMCNYMKKMLGIKLNNEEEIKEDEIK